ncbi:NAD(P)/FAD-dependent oxidoreductase [Streptomyces sp. NPDC058326]|uniref:NAD(P)/FAD-dependent oxidoreductase n=1 Tax=Streptomyces sp. NPDC058326 TaxID=3346447 RepID=UPI0036E5E490
MSATAVRRPERLVVVGASLAGLRAAEAARSAGFTGSLTLIGAEQHLPYDRPPLSKSFLTDPGEPAVPWLTDPAVLRDELGVELRLGARAESLDVAGRTLRAAGETVPYDALVIATGARARTLPGTAGLTGIHTLRTLSDARAVRAALADRPATVVVGSGLIGSEIAAAARSRGCAVTVVEKTPAPFHRRGGGHLGAVCARLHRAHGVDLRCGVSVESFEGDARGRVSAVVLSDGSRLPAQCVVVGIGAVPRTEWLDGSGVAVDDGVVCDDTLATSAPGVWAAGDVARVLSYDGDAGGRQEHWTHAAEQGALAGANAVAGGQTEPFRSLPYFWTDWYGVRVQGVGAIDAGEPWTIGDPRDDSYVVVFRVGDRPVGALGFERPRDMTRLRRLLRRGGNWQDLLDLMEGRKTGDLPAAR